MTALPDTAETRLPLAHLEGPPMPALEVETLPAALARAAGSHPDRTYLGFLDAKNEPTEVSFGALQAGSEAFARALLAWELEPGERVVLLLPTGPDFLEAFFGTLLAGGVPVPWPLPLTMGRIDAYVEGTVARIVADAGASHCITTDRAEESLGRVMEGLGKPGRVKTMEALRADEAPAADFPALSPDGLALLQYTSGRTHLPGGVRLTHRQLLSNVAGVGQALALGEDDVGMSWIPLVHDMGLVGVLCSSLYFRFPSYVMAPEAFLMRPYRWLQAISTFKATLSAAPNFAYRLCVRRVSDRYLEGVDLSSWRLALNGAEQVQPDSCDAFAERFAGVGFQKSAFYPLYGLAENALAATCPLLDRTYETYPFDATIEKGELVAASPSPEAGAPVASVGRPLPGQEIAIVDAAGELLPERHQGKIVVRGVCLMEGIHGRPERTSELKAGGWLQTGDLGFIEDGRLFVTGRLKEMVIKMGRNYYPDDVEQVLLDAGVLEGRRVTALATGNAESGTEDLLLVLEGPAFDEADPKARKAFENTLSATLLDQLGIRADRILHLAPGHLGEGDASARRAAIRTLLREESAA
ncbi:MAG: AMP-binding protein [Deltaproteobacteria bacterium]|nr:AMP-binding protein [Deltaproteobacteria bacterium]